MTPYSMGSNDIISGLRVFYGRLFQGHLFTAKELAVYCILLLRTRIIVALNVNNDVDN